jgi:hypothetical protein
MAAYKAKELINRCYDMGIGYQYNVGFDNWIKLYDSENIVIFEIRHPEWDVCVNACLEYLEEL